MPCAKSQTTVPFVYAKEAMKATLKPFVKSVSVTLLKCYQAILRHLCQLLAGCKSDFECRDDQACINRECQNPCLYEDCGTNAICEARNHRANCICPPNHTGNPRFECRPYECLVDPDCHVTLACRNEKCVDPCPNCAINADCTRQNHKGTCHCRAGFTGDPYGYECIPSELFLNYQVFIFCLLSGGFL
jgi:hypothetical protein